jgi:hypothetical protein
MDSPYPASCNPRRDERFGAGTGAAAMRSIQVQLRLQF